MPSQRSAQRRSRTGAPTEPQGEHTFEAQADEALIDPYQVLAIARHASNDDIKKAYFAKVREFPPEREPAMFKRIRAAYDALRTPEARAATDLFLPRPPLPYEPAKRAAAFDLAFDPADWLTLAAAYSDLARTDFQADERDITL